MQWCLRALHILVVKTPAVCEAISGARRENLRGLFALLDKELGAPPPPPGGGVHPSLRAASPCASEAPDAASAVLSMAGHGASTGAGGGAGGARTTLAAAGAPDMHVRMFRYAYPNAQARRCGNSWLR